MPTVSRVVLTVDQQSSDSYKATSHKHWSARLPLINAKLVKVPTNKRAKRWRCAVNMGDIPSLRLGPCLRPPQPDTCKLFSLDLSMTAATTWPTPLRLCYAFPIRPSQVFQSPSKFSQVFPSPPTSPHAFHVQPGPAR